MDVWDPLFLDSLAAGGFRVITFDYSGLGRSTGEKNYDPVSLARDAHDLIEALDLQEVVIGGWSPAASRLRHLSRFTLSV